MLEVHPVDNSDRARSDEVTRQNPYRGASHGRIGQALAESRFDLVAQLAGRFLGAVQRHLVGDPYAMRITRCMALGLELLVHLRAKPVHQHDFHAHALHHGQVLCQVLQLARSNGFATHANYKGLMAELVDVGCHRAKPGHKGEVENSGHGRHETRGEQQNAIMGDACRVARAPHGIIGQCPPYPPPVPCVSSFPSFCRCRADATRSWTRCRRTRSSSSAARPVRAKPRSCQRLRWPWAAANALLRRMGGASRPTRRARAS